MVRMSIVKVVMFFFSRRRRHTRFKCDGVQTCALPIFTPRAAMAIAPYHGCDRHRSPRRDPMGARPPESGLGGPGAGGGDRKRVGWGRGVDVGGGRVIEEKKGEGVVWRTVDGRATNTRS